MLVNRLLPAPGGKGVVTNLANAAAGGYSPPSGRGWLQTHGWGGVKTLFYDRPSPNLALGVSGLANPHAA